MLKQLLNAFMLAFRSSHKSILRGDYITTDTMLNKGQSYEFTAPADGKLVIQCEHQCQLLTLTQNGTLIDWSEAKQGIELGWPVTNIELRKGFKSTVRMHAATGEARTYLRFYPNVGE